MATIGVKGLINRSSGADFKNVDIPGHPTGNRRVMNWNVNAGKPRQCQPEHKRSRKPQTGQTPKQRNKRTAL